MPSVTRKSQSSRSARLDEIRNRLLEVVERMREEGESYTELSVERLVGEAGMSRRPQQDRQDVPTAHCAGWSRSPSSPVQDRDRARDELRDPLAVGIHVQVARERCPV